jgi:hypothetical protein
MRLTAFHALEGAVKRTLEKITLDHLLTETEKHKTEHGFMFYI